MDYSKLFLVLLLQVKIINSIKYNYCDHYLLKLNITTEGRQFFISSHDKHQIIEEVNRKRNNSNKPMNYVNWDVELDKAALNLLQIFTFYRPTMKQMGRCLVRTTLRNDLYLYGDSTTILADSEIIEAFQLTNRPYFYNFATEEQNITSVGCAIWILVTVRYDGRSNIVPRIFCLFNGINGRLFDNNNPKFTNLRGQILPITHYDGNNSILCILISLTYLLICVISLFLICRKCSRHFRS